MPKPVDGFLSRPGSRTVIELVADKWTIPVIHALARGTRRTGELRKEIPGISQKMLTQTLRNLERHGVVNRAVYPVVPPHVEYSLTALGRSLNEPLAELCRWTERYAKHLHEARADRQRAARRPSAPR